MGERGPAKMPTALKLLHGEKRDSRLNRAAPKPRPNRPRMPRDMTAAAIRIWREVMRDFGPTGILTAIDGPALRVYCETAARYQRQVILLELEGSVIEGARTGDRIKNPRHQIVRDLALLMRAYARELGLVPAARENLTVPSPTSEDPTEKWLRGDQ